MFNAANVIRACHENFKFQPEGAGALAKRLVLGWQSLIKPLTAVKLPWRISLYAGGLHPFVEFINPFNALTEEEAYMKVPRISGHNLLFEIAQN
jgi:hypothetical protein